MINQIWLHAIFDANCRWASRWPLTEYRDAAGHSIGGCDESDLEMDMLGVVGEYGDCSGRP